MKRFLTALGLTASLALAGCVTTTPEASIRAGLTAQQVTDPIPKPGGLTYRWKITRSDNTAFAASLVLRSTRVSGGRTAYRGAIVIPLPPDLPLPDDPNEVARQVSQQLLGVSDAGVRFRGRNLEIPASMTVTPKGQFTSFAIFGQNSRSQPHDCFAIVGTCTYLIIPPDNRPERVTVTTTETDGVWRATSRSPRTGTGRQIYSLDRNGVLLDALLFDQENGRTIVTKFERQ